MTRRSSRGRLVLGAFWVTAGVMHFVLPRTYESIIPTYLAGWRSELVSASGAAEIAGGLAVLPERTRRAGRWWLLATVAAIFPANIHMALNARDFARIPEPLLWARLPFQGVFAWFIWRGTR